MSIAARTSRAFLTVILSWLYLSWEGVNSLDTRPLECISDGDGVVFLLQRGSHGLLMCDVSDTDIIVVSFVIGSHGLLGSPSSFTCKRGTLQRE